MGLEIDPPDVNRSDKVFDVVEGKIVYGLLGIKGLGEAAAEEIISNRNTNGLFKNFMDFLDRVDLHTVNKRAIEVLIKTGSFDNIEPNRNRLLVNMERAVEYAENKKEAGKFGQVSLFEDSGVQEFSDFVYTDIDDWPQLEKLHIEKELIGFYISGHPLDSYRKVFERSVSIKTATIEKAIPEHEYVIAGMVKEIRTIVTKKSGKSMAIVTIEDYDGEAKLTFFPKVWEHVSEDVHVEKVLAFKGKVDHNEKYGHSFQVDTLLDIDSLQDKAINAIHIQLFKNIAKQQQLIELRDFILANTGNCCVYFHVETEKDIFIIKCNSHLTVSSEDEFINKLRTFQIVEDVWKD